RALSDTLRELLDRDAGLHTADVGLAEHQLVEGNVAGGTEFDFLNGARHVGFSTTGGRETLSRPHTRHRQAGPPLTFRRTAATEERHGASTHHAASSVASATASTAGDKKPSRKSAAFDAALAARTTARLSSRSTSSQAPM